MIKSITNFLIIFFIFQQLKSQISQIDQNGYNAFCDETLQLFLFVLTFINNTQLYVLNRVDPGFHMEVGGGKRLCVHSTHYKCEVQSPLLPAFLEYCTCYVTLYPEF